MVNRAPLRPRETLLGEQNGINHVNDPVAAKDVGLDHLGVVNHHRSTIDAERQRLAIDRLR